MKKSTSSKILIIALALIMAFVFTACSSSSGSKEASGSAEGAKVYKVIMEPTFPPFDTTDENGELAGFDVDMMNAIAADQGFEIEFAQMEFGALIPAIEAGNADIIASGMNAEDPERQKKVDFTDTYYDSGLVVMVKVDNDTITGIDSLTPDMKVASQTGTTGADACQELADNGKVAEAVILDGFDTCVLQLKTDSVQAVIIDAPVAASYMKQQSGEFKTVGDVLNAESYGMAVQKGNDELREKLNAGLKNIVENGTFAELCEKWEMANKFE